MASSLTIAGIHASYGAVRVIDDVSLKVGAGETVALLGTNGNGKSTLMKCIMGLVKPSEGSIVAEIDGIHHDLIGRSMCGLCARHGYKGRGQDDRECLHFHFRPLEWLLEDQTPRN